MAMQILLEASMIVPAKQKEHPSTRGALTTQSGTLYMPPPVFKAFVPSVFAKVSALAAQTSPRSPPPARGGRRVALLAET